MADGPRPRLLVLASTYPRWQGDAEPGFVHQLARRLVGAFDVAVLCPHAAGAPTDEEMDGVRVKRYRYAPSRFETLVNDGGIVTNLRRNPVKWLLVPGFLLGQFVATSTQRVLIGFAIGASLGIFLGAITGLARSWDIFLGSTLGAVRAVPSLAWVPLLILWLKIGEESKITLIVIGAFFPVYTTVSSALRHVDRQLVEAGRAFGLHGVKLFTNVQLPAVLPSVISGLRLALAQSWMFLVAAELIASSSGLGFLLVDSQNNGRVDRILLAIILLAVFGKTTDALIGLFEKWAVRRWT